MNVPGKGGVIQVFLSVHPETAVIQRFFFQRLESPAARALRAKPFRDQFTGLSLADFYKHDYYALTPGANPADKVAGLRRRRPTPTTAQRFAGLREKPDPA